MISKKVLKTDSVENELDETFLFCKELGKGCIKRDFSTIGLNNNYSMENVLNVLDTKTSAELIALDTDTVTFGNGKLIKSSKLDDYVDTYISSLTDATSIDSFVKNMKSTKPYFDTEFTLQGFRQTLSNQNVLMPNNNSTKNLDVSTLFAAAYPNATMTSWQVKSTSTPTKGTVSLLGNTLKFMPTPMSYGDDKTVIEVTDSRGVIFELPVTFADIVANSAPTATDGTESGNSFNINWKTRLNVQDADGDVVTASISVQPTQGVAVLNGDTLTYNASENKSGSDSITLLLNDGKGGTTTAVLTVTDIDTLISQVTGDAISIAGGGYHSIILKNDGTVWVSGQNANGELGLGDTADKTSWIQTQITDVKSVTCGYYHSMILKNDGTVWVTGANRDGELGLGDTNSRYSWTQSATDVISVAGGYGHSIIVKNDGTVWVAGKGGMVQDEDEWRSPDEDEWRPPEDEWTIKITSWTQTSLTGATLVACGNKHSLVLKNDGTVWLRTIDDNDVWTQTSLTDVKSVICGSSYSIIVKNDGTVWGTGDNWSGGLGLGDTTDINTWTQTPITDVKSVAGEGCHSIILKNDGTVWVTGLNDYGQLGLGDTTQRNSWTKTSLTDVKSVACGNYHSMILKNDNTVLVAGWNYAGQLGLGDNTDRNTFIQSTSL